MAAFEFDILRNPDADSAKLASRKVLKTSTRDYLVDAIVVQVA